MHVLALGIKGWKKEGIKDIRTKAVHCRKKCKSPSYTCSGNNAVEKVNEISIALPINIDNAYLQQWTCMAIILHHKT